jgi:hypothetical protein
MTFLSSECAAIAERFAETHDRATAIAIRDAIVATEPPPTTIA